MASVLIDNRKIKGGVVSTPGVNTNVYYRRGDDQFNLMGSYNNLETLHDWALINNKESRLLKTGVINMRSEKKSTNVIFRSSFPSSDYFVFFTSSGNVNLYTVSKKSTGFTINSSFSLPEEVSWLAIHRSLTSKTGVKFATTIFGGTRTVASNFSGQLFQTPGVLYEELNMKDDTHVNLDGWYNNQLIIKPNFELDGINEEMNMSDYSVLISSNVNINTYWEDKSSDRVKISTSFPRNCIIDYLFIKDGTNWWKEF